jgi:hypothetical protein
MIRLELLRAGNVPVVLIHGRDSSALSNLVESFKALSRRDAADVEIHRVEGVVPDESCRVVATNRTSRVGIWAESAPGTFRWSQDSEGWIQVADLAEPVAKAVSVPGARFQYLENQGDATVIVSTERAW